MTGRAPRDPAAAVRAVALALLFGSVSVLGAALVVGRSLAPAGPELLSWVAVGLALLAPLAALAVRAAGPSREEGAAGSPGRRIAFLAILEGAVLLCAVALMVAPLEWPLYAALVPLALMVVDVALGG